MAAFNRQETGYKIVSDVLKIMGLPVPVSISGGTDALSTQIWPLLTELGREVFGIYPWTLKQKILTITTDGSLTYDLPDDFEGLIGDTGWNNTTQLPLAGPLSPQNWALIVARALGSSIVQLQWRLRNNKIEFYSVPTDPVEIQFHYTSRGWVQDAADATIFKDTLEDDADICLFDSSMMKAMLRWRWRAAKGFNTTDLQQEYITKLEIAKNADTPGKTMFLDRNTMDFPYITTANIPDTGFGS